MLDASLLQIPELGFLPPDDPRVLGTIRAIEQRLVRDGFVLRYDTEDTDDGYLKRARRFEAYLAGKTETAAERLADLEKSERKLIALEVAGVDNWSGYDEAVADLYDEG